MAINSSRAKGRLTDPSPGVGQRLAAALAEKYGMENRGGASADITLAIKTTDWALECLGPCVIVYHAALRLTDNRNQQLLANGECESSAEEPGLRRSGGGTGYRIDLDAAATALDRTADDCVDTYRRKLFNIFGHPKRPSVKEPGPSDPAPADEAAAAPSEAVPPAQPTPVTDSDDP